MLGGLLCALEQKYATQAKPARKPSVAAKATKATKANKGARSGSKGKGKSKAGDSAREAADPYDVDDAVFERLQRHMLQRKEGK